MRSRSFQLRTFFVLVVLLGLCVGYHAYRVSDQRYAVSRILGAGGYVDFKASFVPVEWLKSLPESFVADHFCQVSVVQFAGVRLEVARTPEVSRDGDTTIVAAELVGQAKIFSMRPNQGPKISTSNRNGKNIVTIEDYESPKSSERLNIELLGVEAGNSCEIRVTAR